MITLASKAKLDAKIADLGNQLASKTVEVETLTKELEASKATIVELNAKLQVVPVVDEAKVKELTEKVESLTKQNEAMANEMKDFEAKVSAKAVTVAASQGTSPVNATVENVDNPNAPIRRHATGALIVNKLAV